MGKFIELGQLAHIFIGKGSMQHLFFLFFFFFFFSKCAYFEMFHLKVISRFSPYLCIGVYQSKQIWKMLTNTFRVMNTIHLNKVFMGKKKSN